MTTSGHSLVPEYQIVSANEQLVTVFLTKLIKGAAQFRYFQKRPLSIIHNHIETVIVLDEVSAPIAYGHLEKENHELWLGLAVADDHTGKGLGREILHHLINTAKANGEPGVKLSVDKDNYKAQRLYQSAGFVQIAEHTTCFLFELELI